MVWVPGGGSISCAQNDERFDGTNFARDGVVLVTLAYRVNVDGFLKLRGGDSGNGNRDILEGLRWVKANIAAFGGDPDKITPSASRRAAPTSSTLSPLRTRRDCWQVPSSRARQPSHSGGMLPRPRKPQSSSATPSAANPPAKPC